MLGDVLCGRWVADQIGLGDGAHPPPHGGHTAAVLFSLLATCPRHQVEPFTYLRDVLTRLAATPVDQLDPFLPDRGKAARSLARPAG